MFSIKVDCVVIEAALNARLRRLHYSILFRIASSCLGWVRRV